MFPSSRGGEISFPARPASSPSSASFGAPTSPFSDFAPSSSRAPETPMDIFLGERYRTLNLAPGELTDEQRQMQQQMLMQQRVEKFFSEGCLMRACLMGTGGGVLGVLFGTFFFSMKPVDVDTTLPFRAQLKQQYQNFLPEVGRSAKNFAKLGFIYSLTECFIQRERAVHDINNAIYAGCVTGATLSYRGGPWAVAVGCAGFAAFSGVMEKLQPFGNMGS
ncbi:putative inner membrane translocase subunit TIM17 [Besnoitia besnoiti]|uniref:Mitochondrial import inner membrane translocase subunit TIM22 n=1 Tax=Besnoitia besnoiti TaxID=94643 RepID=A0A2A9M9N7_BESBE|nr:putative inner membrane translocase subunit TIM17 [Besnoitia besnoiti]PFH35198.1 putative inner membrane translocase subunit TIM17 [Besnoitia besnoiti]